MTTQELTSKDPWRPLSRTVKATIALLAAFFVLSVGSPLLQGHLALDWTYLGFPAGQSHPCMSVGANSYNPDTIHVAGLKRGSIELRNVLVCDDHATGGARVALAVDALADRILLFGALFLLLRLLRGEARRGAFSVETVGRLRFLGWFLVVGEFVVSVIDALTHRVFIESVAVYDSAESIRGWLWLWHPSFLVALVGIALIAFARVMRVGAAMRQDIEATI